MKKFAERLKDLRQEKELSQRQLSELVGLSHNGISQWENEQRIPNAEEIVTLAKYFGVSTDYLLGLIDE